MSLLTRFNTFLNAPVADSQRLMENALPITLNSSRQLASLLGADPLSVVPALGSDNRTAVIDFETMTFKVAPFDEVIIVSIRDTTETARFPLADGLLTRDVQNQILGMLHRSRLADKGISDLSLKGDRPRAKV